MGGSQECFFRNLQKLVMDEVGTRVKGRGVALGVERDKLFVIGEKRCGVACSDQYGGRDCGGGKTYLCGRGT